MTHYPQKGDQQVHRRGKTTAVISGQGGVGSEEVGPGGFLWRQIAQFPRCQEEDVEGCWPLCLDYMTTPTPSPWTKG